MQAPLAIELPVPPSLNEMLALAMKRSRRTRTGGWTRRVIPGIVYDQQLELYETRCLVAFANQRITAPADPWPRWRIVSAKFRLHNLRDWVELMASLKWPVDVLVRQRFVVNDSPRELLPPPTPEQRINRRNLGVSLQIAEVLDG